MRGWRTTRPSATTSWPNICTVMRMSRDHQRRAPCAASSRRCRPDPQAALPARLRLAWLRLLDQFVVARRQPDDVDAAARGREIAHQPLQQPGAKGVEPLDLGHVDGERELAGGLPHGGIDQRLQIGGAVDRPRARCRELEAIARASYVVSKAWLTANPLRTRARPRRGALMRHCPGTAVPGCIVAYEP